MTAFGDKAYKEVFKVKEAVRVHPITIGPLSLQEEEGPGMCVHRGKTM